MSLTPSQMIPLGTPAPDFTLPDTVSGKDTTLKDIAGEKATVVMFICNHCPFVQHINDGLVELSNEYLAKGVGFVGISANDVTTHPGDGPEEMKKTAEQLGYKFPYLYDESQDVAKVYGASCTPDLFIFDADLKLAYHGQFDASRPENDLPVTGTDFRAALDQLIAGQKVPEDQTPSIGCNIKWK